MTSVISTYLGNALLNTYFYNAVTYIALHTSAPTDAGDLATEVSGGDYAREAAVWSPSATKTTGLVNAISFGDLPACTVTWISVWNDPAGGSMLGAVLLPTPLVVPESGAIVITPNDIAVTL